MMVALNTLSRKIQRLENLHCLKIEAKLRNDLLQSLACERLKQELAVAVRSDDTDLIDCLPRHGFNAENLPALSLLPIALVVWGSGYVTEEERMAAMNAIYDSEISGNQVAISKFESWLDSRPSRDLLELWADFTRSRIKNLRPGVREAQLDRMIRLASEVAVASGGILGFGEICAGEQSVLDQIRKLSECYSDLSA